MKAIYKFGILIFILAGYIVIGNVVLADSFFWQILILFVVLVLGCLKFGINRILTELKLILPFIVTMLIVYLILGIVGFRISSQGTESSSFTFWLQYGLNKSLIFINTVLFIQFILSYIRIEDILNLPVKMSVKKYFILGRSLFAHTLNHLGELEFHLKLMPEYQKRKLSIRQWFNLKLQLSYGIISMLLRESQIKGEYIDNRIRHCFTEISKHQ